MWTTRAILFGGLVVWTWLDFRLLAGRQKHGRLIENWVFNLLDVVAYNACCYLIAALPPAGGWDHRPLAFFYPSIRIGFPVLGAVLIFGGILLFGISLCQRRVLGLQDVPSGLLTGGIYRHFRHPIYAGILSVSLGLALLTRNPDGLLMFPALLGLIAVQALVEEKYDMGVRFAQSYRQYRLVTRMFGPAWLWSLLLVTLLLLALYPARTGRPGLARLWSRSAAHRIRTDGITSYYVYAGTDTGPEGKLPTTIFIGHLHSSPFRDLSIFKNWFDEPVLLISSGLMSDLRGDCLVENEANWAKKRQQFLTLLDDYKRRLPIDEDRIYLTGFSSAGVYAWMLAYDHPELYAGVVAMSATSYPRQIQEHLEAARTLVTVVVRGEKDETMQRHLAGETRTGRIIESSHSGSRFVLKPGEGHQDMGKYWRENLQYVLQFRRNEGQQRDDQPPQQSGRSK